VVKKPIPQTAFKGDGVQFILPAPFQGLNTRDSFNVERVDEARFLQNFFPDNGTLKVRPGYQLHQTANSTLQSAFVYNGATGGSLLVAGGNKIYNVTGSPTQISTTTITNNVWNTENYQNSIIGVNGTDAPWKWDGTTFGATTFKGTGLTLSTLNKVSLVRTRLWFTATNSADVWYARPNFIGGDLTKFPLSQIAAGGKCVDINSFSLTGGEGSQADATVFIMDTGEIIVYSGDPGGSTNTASGSSLFSLVGHYRAPQPIISSYGCTVKVGGQLLIWTQSGVIPMTAIMQDLGFNPDQLGPWGKVAPSMATDYATYGANDGWSATYHNGVLYFNIITGTTTTKQYVYNTRSSAWTTYDGLPAGQFASVNSKLYFSEYQGTHVYLHQGGTDNGGSITATARQNFSYPEGDQAGAKQFTLIKPIVIADGPIQGQFQVDTDFVESPIDSATYALTADGASSVPWDSPWDSAWSSDTTVVQNKWRPLLGAYGNNMAPVVRLYSTADNAKWESSAIVTVPGAIF
jgi:hypothetical protein